MGSTRGGIRPFERREPHERRRGGKGVYGMFQLGTTVNKFSTRSLSIYYVLDTVQVTGTKLANKTKICPLDILPITAR